MGVEIANGQALVAHEISLSGAPHAFFVTHGVDNSTAKDADEIAEDVRVVFSTAIFAPGGAVNAATGFIYKGTKVLSRTAGGTLTAGTATTAVVGTGTNTSPPSNVCLLIHKRTGLAGRRFRGRMFLPTFGMAEAAVDSAGLLSGATVTAWQTRFDALKTALALANLSGVLQHSDGAVGTPISSWVVSGLVGTQRGRLR